MHRNRSTIHPLLLATLSILLAGVSLFHAKPAQAAEPLISIVPTAFAKEPVQADESTLDQRKAILKEIISASQDEVSTLGDKLSGLSLPDEWNTAKTLFIARLATSTEFYRSLQQRLDDPGLTVDDAKSIAKELKDWRESTYLPQAKEITNLLLISQSDSIYRIVQGRDAKISNDIKKLDRQKLVNTAVLKKYLGQAEQSIKNARSLNDKARDLYYTTSVEPLHPRGSEATDSGTTTAAATTSAGKTAEDKRDPQDQVRDLAKDSLKELKAAYELFFKMNDWIRK